MSDQTGKMAVSLAADSAACPGAEALSAFCCGSLADRELATIAEHLSRCETCEQTVRDLTSAGDPLSSRLRAAVQQPQPIEEPALLRMQSAAKALLAVRPETATSETALDAESAASGPLPDADVDRRRTATVTEMWSPMRPATIGRYAIQSQLGQGGFGTVYLARDPDLDRLVAIKVPKFAAGITDEKIQWFLAEARTAAGLNHPAIVGIYEIGRSSDGSCYIVMEYVEGHSLSQEMARGKLPLERAVKIIASAAAAVHYAHKKGLVHRDLKPGNILLDAEGQVKIADFGLAIHEDQQRGRAGERAGTLAYMSPEQVRGEVHRLDGRADVWSLGVILYELLIGRRPFAGTPREMADEILNRPPKPPRQIDDTIPATVEQVCLKCLSKEAEARYSSAGDMAAALDRVARRSRQSPRFHMAISGALATVALIAIAGGLYVAFQSSSEPEIPYFVDKMARPFVPLALMDRAPEKMFAISNPNDRWGHNRSAEEVWIDSSTANLFGLGLTGSPRYRLRVDIVKNSEDGYSGLFLGYRPIPNEGNEPRWQCQVISINKRPLPGGVANVPMEMRNNKTVDRELLTIIGTSGGTFTVQRRHIAGVTFDGDVSRGVLLEVTIKANHITEIHCGGRPLDKLVDFTNPRVAAAPSCEGRFGLLNSAGAATFRNGRFESLNDTKP